MKKGKLNRRVRIERPQADESYDGAGSGTWAPVAEAMAEVQDMIPSRGERLADGINAAARPARVRMQYRTGITSDMRLLIGRYRKDDNGDLQWITDRIAQIITMPAELGMREGLEFMIEDYSQAGSAA